MFFVARNAIPIWVLEVSRTISRLCSCLLPLGSVAAWKKTSLILWFEQQYKTYGSSDICYVYHYICASCPPKDRRGYQILWNWSYRWYKVTSCGAENWVVFLVPRPTLKEHNKMNWISKLKAQILRNNSWLGGCLLLPCLHCDTEPLSAQCVLAIPKLSWEYFDQEQQWPWDLAPPLTGVWA